MTNLVELTNALRDQDQAKIAEVLGFGEGPSQTRIFTIENTITPWDLFAAAALIGVVASDIGGEDLLQDAIEDAISLADGLFAERQKRIKKEEV